ncbi:MAG: hypothetical protein LUQ66_12935 [Methanoregula sp.]|nr:hypothetical protein [Methanoregula sp.]
MQIQIELRRGMYLYPGSYNAVVAPETVMAAAINNNADLQRYLFLHISGNYSRLLSRINRGAKNFDVQRAFTAHQFLSVIRGAAHTIVLIEHDPLIFEGAENMVAPIAMALKDAGRDALVILYTPAIDNRYAALMRHADRVIEIATTEDLSSRTPLRNLRMQRNGGSLVSGQKTLEVS